VIAIFESAIFEALHGKEFETFRKVTAQRHGKLRHITRRADLATIRQTRRVCEGRACNAELARSGGNDLGKPGFRASQLFRHYSSGVIRRLGYQGADYFENRNCLVLNLRPSFDDGHRDARLDAVNLGSSDVRLLRNASNTMYRVIIFVRDEG